MNKPNPEAKSTSEPSPLRQAVDCCGSIAALARAILIYPNNVAYYLRTGKPVPAEWAIPIEKATQGRVSRELLRPDVFTEPNPIVTAVRDPALRWKQHPDGCWLYLGNWPVAEVWTDQSDAKWAASCRLPGLKSDFGQFDTEAAARSMLEKAVHYWFGQAVAQNAALHDPVTPT